jgi:hypothetical protein
MKAKPWTTFADPPALPGGRHDACHAGSTARPASKRRAGRLRFAPPQGHRVLSCRKEREHLRPAAAAYPATPVLRITPPSIAGMSPVEIARDVEDRVRLRERELRADAKAAGRSFMGRAAVLAMTPFERHTPREPRSRLSPRVAAGVTCAIPAPS